MNTTDINNINRKRFNSTRLISIGFILCLTATMLGDLAQFRSIPLVIAITVNALIGASIAIAGLVGIIKVTRILKSDSKLREILCDEMYVANIYKSYAWGFWAMVGVAIAFMAISVFTTLPARFVCQFSLLAGLSTSLISCLIMQKETKDEYNSDK